MKNYLVGVVELAIDGKIKGTHHVSSTAAENAEDASKWALNDTACDWYSDPDKTEDLHILFVMSTPVGTDITVEIYDEGSV